MKCFSTESGVRCLRGGLDSGDLISSAQNLLVTDTGTWSSRSPRKGDLVGTGTESNLMPSGGCPTLFKSF